MESLTKIKFKWTFALFVSILDLQGCKPVGDNGSVELASQRTSIGEDSLISGLKFEESCIVSSPSDSSNSGSIMLTRLATPPHEINARVRNRVNEDNSAPNPPEKRLPNCRLSKGYSEYFIEVGKSGQPRTHLACGNDRYVVSHLDRRGNWIPEAFTRTAGDAAREVSYQGQRKGWGNCKMQSAGATPG